ncbi:MAG: helix-turn-helix domain-containing protein [Povalibacter sp.]
MQPTLVRGSMRYFRIPADTRIRAHVYGYGLVNPPCSAGFPEPNGTLEKQVILPDGHSEIVFKLKGDFTRHSLHSDADESRVSGSYVIGGRSQSIVTRNLSELRLVCIKMNPRFLHALIQTSLADFRDGTISLKDLNSAMLSDLEDAVANAKSPEQIQRRLDAFFLRRLATLDPAPSVVDALVQRINASHANLSIMQFARTARLDPRTLERRFIAAMGMTPREYARIVRFKRAYGRWLFGDARSKTLKTHLEGYYDQSHFDREFMHFLGDRPRQRESGRPTLVSVVSDHLLEGEEEAQRQQA